MYYSSDNNNHYEDQIENRKMNKTTGLILDLALARAPYTVVYTGGNSIIRLNQEINGGEWNSLGVYPFSEGLASVILSDDAEKVVIADAIRLVKTD